MGLASACVLVLNGCDELLKSPIVIAITTDPAEITIEVGDDQQFLATGAYDDGTSELIAGVMWSSSDMTVASIEETTGLAKGLLPGTVTVTASFDSVSGTATLIVKMPLGISVSRTSGLITTEAGAAEDFAVVLNTEPAADVTLAISSSDASEGTVSLETLIFTPANWFTPQTVTVTGTEDYVADLDQAYSVIIGPAVSDDADYDGIDPEDVSVTNTDDDTPGIIVDPTVGLVVSEAGQTDGFTVVLTSQPIANVTIDLIVSDSTEGALSATSLTFTPETWSAAQTVVVSGVDEADRDKNQVFSIELAPAVSDDPDYNERDPDDISSVTNIDNDTPGVTVSPVSGLLTKESGTSNTFSVYLNKMPEADVVIAVASSDETEGTAAPASLTFTAANWATAQTVTVTGVDDLAADGDQVYTIELTASSADSEYDVVDPSDVSALNIDNDTPGIDVSPTSGLVTMEDGRTASFTVVLITEPTADVTVAVSSGNTDEGTVSPASLTFTTSDWSLSQTITVTGVDDAVHDGDQAYTIVTAAASSLDADYDGLNADDVSATNFDDDAVGISVTPTVGLVTTEAGGQTSFEVVLDSEPVADVTLDFSSSDVGEGTASPSSLIFTAGDWSTAQVVTVTGENDDGDDDDQSYTILTAAAESADPDYDGLDPADVSVTNHDDDVAGITLNPTTLLVTTEAGGSATFTVRLDTKPTDAVALGFASSDTGEGTLSPVSVTFTTADWATEQTITVTGVDDTLDDDGQAYLVQIVSVTSPDGKYDGFSTASDVSVTNQDDDILLGGAIQGNPLSLTTLVSTFAGSHTSAGSQNGDGATEASFNLPTGVTTDGANLYVADYWNNLIRKIVIATGQVSTFAGSGDAALVNGIGTAASFKGPVGITTDGTNLYVADRRNHKIRKIVISTKEVTTFAETVTFSSPTGITTDGANLYVVDLAGGVKQIPIATETASTIAAGTTFFFPSGITTDGANLYVTDYEGDSIRKIVIETEAVTMIAAGTTFNGPAGITTDGTVLFVTEYENNKVWQIVIGTDQASVVAGSGLTNWTNGVGEEAAFDGPFGITTNGKQLYLADEQNHSIRKIE